MSIGVTRMGFELKYIHVFDDINSSNIKDISEFYSNANIRVEEIRNPSFMESNEISARIGSNQIKPAEIHKILSDTAGLNTDAASELAKDMYSELRMLVKSDDAVRSSVIKVVYWLRNQFKDILENYTGNNIYINIQMNKQFLYLLYALSKLGNNIVIVDENYNQEMYKLYNNFQLHIDNTHERKRLGGVTLISVDEALEIIDINKVTKGKTLIIGEDKAGSLNNKLCEIWDEQIENSKYTIYSQGIPMPNVDEISRIQIYADRKEMSVLLRQFNVAVFNNIRTKCYKEQAYQFARSFLKKESNYDKAVNKLTLFVALLNRYDISYDKYICYGEIHKRVVRFFDFLYEIGKQVVVIDTAGSMEDRVDQGKWKVVQVGDKMNYHPYPNKVINKSIAYNASREIDEMLYSGDTPGLYRDRHYKTCSVVGMSTTFDEMLLLWKSDNTVRPGFRSDRNGIVIPVIYARVLGVCNKYKDKISEFSGDHSIIYYSIDEVMGDAINTMEIQNGVDINSPRNEQKPLVTGAGLDIEYIISMANFSYKHLDTDVQLHVLNKLNNIINGDNLYGCRKREFIDRVLNVGLNLSKRIQQEMQWYDYTKQSPKLVIICNTEKQLGINESILCTLINNCGWDIVFIVPTHYNILGKNINSDGEVQDHVIGDASFNEVITELKPKQIKKGLFKRIFN